MVVEYRYSWRNGALVKTDPDGNMLNSTQAEPVSHIDHSQPEWHNESATYGQSSSDGMEGGSEQPPTGADSPLQAVDENALCEPPTPEKLILSKEDLAKRDREAVAYSKALLVEGDTLVYISYPGDSKCFDSTGFEISAAPHRVHSGRLLATGSKVFAKLLSSTNQYRILRRKRLVGNLPAGVKYVLDLTPPDEGDEAVQLTSELSCSLGVRLWYTAAQRCGISLSLVGGEDEVMDPRNVASYGATTVAPLLNATEPGTGHFRSITDDPVDTHAPASAWEAHEIARQNREIADAVRMSLEELSKTKAKANAKGDAVDVPEYCPIRHRAGIGRLLRVIEGKEPRLDSAPKVWTLFVLAKYFDCTGAVVDWIVSWIIADPNTQFIEILPEASCKMAFGLNNQMICRAAFSILVSEEALSLASRETGRGDADRKGTNQFGRLREDIDEDIRTRIEYASKNFASRICKTFEALTDEEMSWVTQLPEYQKLQKFKIFALSQVGKNDQAKEWLSAIDQLSFELRTYVRTRIIASLATSLTPDQSYRATSHRRAETYTNVSKLKKSDVGFSLVYDGLLDKERIFTRFFWLNLLYAQFPIWFNGARPSDFDLKMREAYLAGARPSIAQLVTSQKHLNESILESIKEKLFNEGIMPLEALPVNTQSYAVEPEEPPNYGYSDVAISKPVVTEAPHPIKSWNPFHVFKSAPTIKEAQVTDDEYWNTSLSDDWKDEGANLRNSAHWDAGLTNYGVSHKEPLIPKESEKENGTTHKDSRGMESAGSENMDVDEYLAQHHLLNPKSGLEKAATSEIRFPVANSDLPHRPKAKASVSPAQNLRAGHDEMGRVISEKFEPTKYQPFKIPIWTPDESSTGQVKDKHPPRWKGESYLTRTLRDSQHKQPVSDTHLESRRIIDPTSRYLIPSDDKIHTQSPFFNMSKIFFEAKDHIHEIATIMLDQREMGFDVALTDTLLCLGPEEFKYLPLWAGGDDDGSGGVFDETIPFPLAGPNGPGPSFHTGFSNASMTSSEFDTMSDKTAFNTSVAVEDGYSDHVDRRLIIADDDFHSETFSEDSEVYDRKGKGVDRSGFFTSAPASEASFSIVDSTPDSVPGVKSPEDSSAFEMEYEQDDGSDADTTVGQADDGDDDDDAWDGGDMESFDFGDSDEEMANV